MSDLSQQLTMTLVRHKMLQLKKPNNVKSEKTVSLNSGTGFHPDSNFVNKSSENITENT